MKVGIAGLGLIGGSLAKAYNKSGAVVYGYDGNRVVQDFAKLQGVLEGDLDENTVKECDLLLVALYPQVSIEYLKKIAPYIPQNTLVMDCCGVKREICEVGFALADEYGFTYVGGHPMAGTQFSGYANSRADLFQGAPLVLVPPAVDDALKLELLGQVREMVRPLGFGKFSVTSAAEHDRVIAFTSQLAHVVSNAYVKSPTAQVHHGFSAGSYRDLTRVAHLNPQMWSELMIDDADALAFEIDHLIDSLGAYSHALKNRDQRYLENLLAEGDRIKRALDDESAH